MASPTGFQVTNSTVGFTNRDFDDLFVRKECFLESGLWMVGRNNAGQLGDNTIINRSSPVQTISGGTNWRTIGTNTVASAGIKTDGTLWLWGSGYAGLLGDGTTVAKSSPVQTASGGNNWKCVSLGYSGAAAVKTDGTLWVWGTSSLGSLGTGALISRSSPTQTASAGTNWVSVTAGGSVRAAIKNDGTLWTWGSNLYGMLGSGGAGTANRSSPNQTASGGTNWKSVSFSCSRHITAIKTDGTLWVWGSNDYGELGTNNIVARSTPTQTVTGGTNWKTSSAGQFTSGAIKTDGTLWMWGRGAYGTLGDNTITNKSSPVQTFSCGNNWRQLSVGNCNVAAIKTDGTLWVWGFNDNGRLGLNLGVVSRSSPVQTVTGGTNWRCVSANGFNMSMLRQDCW